ncbi:hypothetical protein [Micromonospora sp. WMMD812]|uniref:hypothetical protein n=1 Tax=Micromonospora sp. WMMD812 TaxID=3015152 RepID=UPI00248B3D6D|nr:hypothetical protein [Micromonospora sp. WMMD812]WBB68470.1 hypothetical protein O7603_03560 [Micromonospora sp. WMMD812]
MSGDVLVSALVVGLMVGAAGWLPVPGRTAVPLWLTLALGVAAALLGAIVVRLAGAGADDFTALLIAQSCGAGTAVLLAVLSGRRRTDRTSGP